MSGAVRIRRKNTFNLFREGRKLGSFDEFPMLRPEVDPQLHASFNSVDQPFHLLCEKDTIIAQVTGRSRVTFREGATRYFDLGVGDCVYVPGSIPHRITTLEPGFVNRYKAVNPGLEATVWYCESCGEELKRFTWRNEDLPPQIGYLSGCEQYNADPAGRTCEKCGAAHDPINMDAFRWGAIAEALSADGN